VLAHELYHLLADSVEGHVFGECTSQFSPSPSERRANAFAAELLLPAVALPAYLHVHPEFKVREICGKYGVGWELCVRQLVNHKRITRDLAQALLDDVEIRHRAE
jgi:Zn-dependent peptidase ImmA (M78 family)